MCVLMYVNDVALVFQGYRRETTGGKISEPDEEDEGRWAEGEEGGGRPRPDEHTGRQGGGKERKPFFYWQGPGGWDGPGAASASEWTSKERARYRDIVVGGGVDTDADADADLADGAGASGGAGGNGRGGGGGEDNIISIPSFREFIDGIEGHLHDAPPALRPVSSLCGQQSSPFDSIIPFERLQVRRVCVCVYVCVGHPLRSGRQSIPLRAYLSAHKPRSPVRKNRDSPR